MKNRILILLMVCGVILFCFNGRYALAQNIGFVETNGSQFELNGCSFYFSGGSQYYLFYKSENMIDWVFSDAKALGLKAFRTWGMCDGVWKEGYSFQPSAGVYDENTFAKMDYIIYKAGQDDIRLIIPLVDNWDNSGGMNKYVEWSPTASVHDDFYTDSYCRQYYKDYVRYFLNRVNSITGVSYKNDPTIMIWELANEPRCQTDPTGDKLQAWIDEMAAYIKSIDPIHLVSTGEDGWYKKDGATDWKYNGSEGVDFIRNHQSPYIDVCSFHLYPNDNGMTETEALTWIDEHIGDAHNVIGKPVYAGEFGWKVDRSADPYDKATLHNFAVDKENFFIEWGYTSIGRISAPSYDGNGSLKFSANLTAKVSSAGGRRDYAPPKGYSVYDYLSAWVYIPANAPKDLSAGLYVRTTSSLVESTGDKVTLGPGKWVQVKITPAQIAAGSGSISDVRQIGIRVDRTKTNYKGDIYYDLFEGNSFVGDLQMETRNRIYADWYNRFNFQDADGAGFWILSSYQDDGTLYPDYDQYTVYYSQDAATSPIIQNFSSAAQNKSGLPVGNPHLWDGCEAMGNWIAAAGYSDCLALSPSNGFVNEGFFSLKADFSSPVRYKAFIENSGDNSSGLNEDWSVKTALTFNLYNAGDAATVAAAISTGPNWLWYESVAQPINSGWNTLVFDLKADNWKSAASNWQNNTVISDLNQVKRVSIGVFGYSAPGSFYVDGIQLF
ncbi:MAG: cellulase family glycosylhydrolase [Candidatus Omnitrophota bacterium]